MSGSDQDKENAIRQRAYFIWERAGRPEGRAQDLWVSATVEEFGGERGRDDNFMEDEEKVLAGHPDANMPALLTKDVQAGDRHLASGRSASATAPSNSDRSINKGDIANHVGQADCRSGQ